VAALPLTPRGHDWTVVSRRGRRKAMRLSYTPQRCDQCELAYVFPSRTAYRNHLKWAHRLYLACTCRYVRVDRPDHTLRARAVPPAAEPRPTPVPSGPVPPRPLLHEICTPLYDLQTAVSLARRGLAVGRGAYQLALSMSHAWVVTSQVPERVALTYSERGGCVL